MKIKQGDTVLMISGDDRGRSGKVIKVFPKKGVILIEGMNIQKKHRRPKKEGEKGQIVEKPGFIPIGKVKLICSKCKKATRVGYRAQTETKEQKSQTKSRRTRLRICKKCGETT